MQEKLIEVEQKDGKLFANGIYQCEVPKFKEKQTQVTTYTIMEYIKSHNLSLEYMESLSQSISEYTQEMIRNSLNEKTKFEIMKKQIKAYWSKHTMKESVFNKEFSEFLSKVTK